MPPPLLLIRLAHPVCFCAIHIYIRYLDPLQDLFVNVIRSYRACLAEGEGDDINNDVMLGRRTLKFDLGLLMRFCFPVGSRHERPIMGE